MIALSAIQFDGNVGTVGNASFAEIVVVSDKLTSAKVGIEKISAPMVIVAFLSQAFFIMINILLSESRVLVLSGLVILFYLILKAKQ
ncbi:hypothetical protein GCM10016272_17780 [Psychrobacter glaciei]|uniref:EamA domain-containing protein n=1 Tax=Psychrobacter glaciei TaxID=619771 RepID=A0ABQ3GT35_9GAMM|nr:hypothetical protein GCM10016272_17780 [Psychrobacter glaciei]